MAEVVRCSGLVKRFGSTTALDGLDLVVQPGEVHGFLGPNGAGKTVTMRILLGLLRRDGGDAVVFGHDPWVDSVELHRRLAYVPGDTNLWPHLSGGEILDLLGDLHGSVDRGRRDRLVQAFDLDLRKKARSYSKGNRQKVALIAALATDAELLVLDEPTAGLDPLMEQIFRREIADVRAEGRAVLLSSHILAEVERVCDRVTIIRDGRAVESGTLEELRHLRRTTINVLLDEIDPALADQTGVHDLRHQNGRVIFDLDSDRVNDVMAHLTGLGIRSLISQPPTLEDLFMRHYGTGIDDDAR